MSEPDSAPTVSASRPTGRLGTRPWRTTTDETPVEGPARADNPAYVAWLVAESMLQNARETGRQLTGLGAMWQNAYALPDPRAAGRAASVWFTAYPTSLVNAPGSSYLATLADADLWRAFASIGIQAVHTGPVKRAGGIDGWTRTPSRRRALRPDQHAGRPGLRHGGRVPHAVRRRRRPRRRP